MAARLAVAVLTLAALALTPAVASADPGANNKNALFRVFDCSNGAEDLEVVFVGLEGVNFNVTSNESVFVYKTITFDRPPLGPSENDEVDDRGIQGFDPASLTTCDYVTSSGTHVTVTGFFTPSP
jgi:hypothetical protein